MLLEHPVKLTKIGAAGDSNNDVAGEYNTYSDGGGDDGDGDDDGVNNGVDDDVGDGVYGGVNDDDDTNDDHADGDDVNHGVQ